MIPIGLLLKEIHKKNIEIIPRNPDNQYRPASFVNETTAIVCGISVKVKIKSNPIIPIVVKMLLNNTLTSPPPELCYNFINLRFAVHPYEIERKIHKCQIGLLVVHPINSIAFTREIGHGY